MQLSMDRIEDRYAELAARPSERRATSGLVTNHTLRLVIKAVVDELNTEFAKEIAVGFLEEPPAPVDYNDDIPF